MMEGILQGLQLVMTAKVWGLMLLATLLGNFFGVVPGLGGTLGLALLIPFVYGMAPFPGLAFLLAMHAVVNTGGSIPSILFGIPGTGSVVATIVDGHPMAKQGKAGEAMGAQLAASCMGGIIGGIVLALFIPLVKPIAMAFGPPEIFMLVVFGLTFIVVISRESVLRGFISALLGLLIGTIGLNPFTGVGRFTFNQIWLWEGVNTVTLVLGIFAFCEVIELGARGRKAMISEVDTTMRWSQLWEGTKEVFRQWWLALRTAVIGTFIGMIPGLGGDAASWICYGHAAQTCRNNENFGKGDIRGVIGVETANNAKEGGALLPTIVFGIPGSSGMAILLGAFLILGITPGPTMITDHLDIVWGMVWVLIIANIIGAVTLYPISGYMGNLAFLRGSLLITPIMILATLGAYLVRSFWQDILLAACFGFLGYGMKKWRFDRSPMILGFVLGSMAEGYLIKSLVIWGVSFLRRPIVLTLLFLMLISLGFSLWRRFQEHNKVANAEERTGWGGAAFAALLLFPFALSIYLSQEWSIRARIFPLLLGIAGATLCIILMIVELRKCLSQLESGGEKPFGGEKPEKAVSTKHKTTLRGELSMMLWVIGFICLILFFGFWVAMAVFTPAFMFIFGHENWKLVAATTIGLWLTVYLVFVVGLQTELYRGLLGISW